MLHGIEPPLQTITGECLTLGSANREDGARLDIPADNFLGRNWNRTFFDIWVFSPFSSVTEILAFLSQCYIQEKWAGEERSYDQRVGEVEHGVFSTSGGMGQKNSLNDCL